MISTLVQLSLVVFFPKILAIITGSIRNRNKMGQFIQISRYNISDLWRIMVPLILAISLLAKLFNFLPQPNYFLETKTPLDSPAFLIRNHYRSFLEHLSEKDLKVKALFDIVDRENLNNLSFDQIPVELHDTARKMQRYDYLSQEMRLKESKNFYFSFGEDAFRGCTLCNRKQPFEFLAFAAPAIAFTYFHFLLAIGLLCVSVRKRRLLFLAVLTCSILIGHDVCAWYLSGYSSPVFLYETLFGPAKYLTKYEQLEKIRAAVLSFVLAIGLMFDFPSGGNDVIESLRSSIKSVEKMIRQCLWQNASRSVIGLDDHLRRQYNDHWQLHASKLEL